MPDTGKHSQDWASRTPLHSSSFLDLELTAGIQQGEEIQSAGIKMLSLVANAAAISTATAFLGGEFKTNFVGFFFRFSDRVLNYFHEGASGLFFQNVFWYFLFCFFSFSLPASSHSGKYLLFCCFSA